MRILIVGAGIGGLNAALALLRDGHEVAVYEQASQLAELGAGVQVSANGSRVLFALGLEQALRRVWSEPVGKEIRLWNTGETWKLFDLGAESVARYGAPYFMIHRADLHGVLIDAVRALKPGAIHLDARGSVFDDDGKTVTLHIANRERVTAPPAAIRSSAISWSATKSRSSPAAWRGAGWWRSKSFPRTCAAMSAST